MARRLPSCARIGLVIALMIPATGCVGTVFTRFPDGGGAWAGGYPFQALVFDAEAIASDWRGGHAGLGVAIPLLATFSWPWDLAIDALLSPADLVLWLFGFEKASRS